MRKYIDIVTESAEVEEGFKSAVAGVALGAAALTGGFQHSVHNPISNAPTETTSSSDQLAAIQNMHFSQKAERVARSKGFESAQAMMLWMYQQNKGGTHQRTAMDNVEDGVSAATAMHPASILGMVADRYKDATGQE